MSKTIHRTCTLCEAMCGLTFHVEGDRVAAVEPDHDDVFSHGYVCPKGIASGELHHDPDRLRTPMRRTASGDFEPIGWDEAMDLAGERLRTIRKAHGGDAIAVYMGNPIAHNHGVLLLRHGLMQSIGTRNATSSGSQDTSPRFAASYYLYGDSLAVPVPDLDRTDYLLCVGANPRVSNGSFLAAPNVRQRLRAIRNRGGKVVVVDPRRSETARDADEHVPVLPGGDAALLLSMVQVLVEEGRVDRAAVDRLSVGWEQIEPRLAGYQCERVADHVGIDAATIRRLALEFVDAPTSAAYSRVGVCNTAYGTLATYATDLLNLAAGRLGRQGGSMFSTPPFDATPVLKWTKGDGHARWTSRVRGLPETLGELPASILAEEIETPGEGQVRAMVTFAGNPVLSTPNGARLDRALEQLDFMVSVDLYINETTRHADLVLPPAGGLTEDHVDLIFGIASARNAARWSPPVLPKPAGERWDWEIVLDLCYRLGGGPTGLPALDRVYRHARKVGLHWSPNSSLDLLLRIGPFGDRFRPWSRGLNLRRLKRAEHGIDLGPLVEGIAHRVTHHDGRVHLAAPLLLEEIDALAASLTQPPEPGTLLLIGRRDLRSNNSWMHNVPSLVTGRFRCTLLVHPADAQRAGVSDGETALLANPMHTGEVVVEVSDEMRPGVVSLPHGWGHASIEQWQATAGAQAGVSANLWTDDQRVERLVGQSILNGVPVALRPIPGQSQSANRAGLEATS